MGEVFHAFQHLNDTLKLGLKAEQLARAEAGFKSRFAEVSNPDPQLAKLKGNADAISQEYEFVAVLQPRARKLSATELKTMADKAVKTNLAGIKLGAIPVNVDRLKAASVKTVQTGAAKTPAGKLQTP